MKEKEINLEKILHKRLEAFDDMMLSIEYVRENNIKIRDKDKQDLVNRTGHMYDFLLSINRRDKLEIIKNKTKRNLK